MAEAAPSGSTHGIRPSPAPDLGPVCWVRLVSALGRPGGRREKQVNGSTLLPPPKKASLPFRRLVPESPGQSSRNGRGRPV